MGIYTHTNLKAGIGEEQYLRFFALISSLFAIKEKQSLVPNKPENFDDLIGEINSLNNQYHILDNLAMINKAARYVEKKKMRGCEKKSVNLIPSMIEYK